MEDIFFTVRSAATRPDSAGENPKNSVSSVSLAGRRSASATRIVTNDWTSTARWERWHHGYRIRRPIIASSHEHAGRHRACCSLDSGVGDFIDQTEVKSPDFEESDNRDAVKPVACRSVVC